MALFQTSVLTNYLKRQDSAAVARAYKKFAAYFLNSTIQQNIRESKEEQYQEGFLRELFVAVLGYTLNPHADYNLTTELKNEKGAKKADGAILKNGNALAVIELKGTKTKDLESVRQQAFDYKANQTGCVFVITSNFEKLRFYVNNAVEYEEFDLFNLTEEQFALLYLCLEKDNLLNSVALKIKEESLQEEEQITKRFYADYSLFKRELFRDLVKQNMKNEVFKAELNKEDIDRANKNIKHTLFKKSQKLIDRFLFIFFAEDRDLLPPNSTLKILESWEQLNNLDAYAPLYDRFKIYFNYLDIGRQGTDKKAEIFAYNGGLFKPDSVLNSLIISDELLLKHTKTLSHYDFASQVDVNILGHIFENSLNEIESVNAEIEGVEFDKQKTKRKKDGVFYTPKYITKYIVENTVGKLCEEKKTELGIVEDDYLKNRKGRTTVKLKELQIKLETYRTWLLGLTICDPACGSGAFLNQALDFLIKEHQYLDELQTSLLGGGFTFPDIENTVLENNIFGVDLNEESVEIAKLSLWLRTAQPRRKLNDLSSNIKCGNSLIDDKAVAGDKAFNWYKEFPQVFPNYEGRKKEEIPPIDKKEITGSDEESLLGTAEPRPFTYGEGSKGFEKYGFDVVIGNPPYVRQELLGDYKDYFSKNYKVFNFSSDLFAYFYEKAFSIMKHNGIFSFISNTFDKTTAGVDLRIYLKNNVQFLKYVDFTQVQIFEGATTYPIILIAKNNKRELDRNSFGYIKIPSTANPKGIDIDIYDETKVEQKSLDKNNWTFKSTEANGLSAKIQQHKTIREKYGKCYYGVKTALNEAFITENSFEIGEHVKPIYEGWEVKKWATLPAAQKLLLFKSKWTKNKYGNDITEELALLNLKNEYPKHFELLMPFEEKAKQRSDKGDFWWELRNCAYYDLFEKSKIIFPNLQNSNKFCFDDLGMYLNAPAVFIPTESKALLAILNSKLVWNFLKSICVIRSGGYIEVKPQYFEQIPIPDIELNNEHPLTAKAESNITATKKLQTIQEQFLKLLQVKFTIEKLSIKLQNWDELDFKDFLKELKKAKVQLSLPEEAEWMQYFNAEKEKAQALKKQITDTDKEIDLMVYKLYELTYDEVKIIDPEFVISKENYS